MPPAPPVTIAVFPVNRFVWFIKVPFLMPVTRYPTEKTAEKIDPR
jgi:hypothetical protein